MCIESRSFCSDEYSTRGKLSRLGIKMESWLWAGKVSLIFSPRAGQEFQGLFFFEFYRKAEWRLELTDISAIHNPTMLPFSLKKLDCMYSRLEGIFQNDPLLMPETRKTGRTRPFLPVISLCKDFYKEKRFTA